MALVEWDPRSTLDATPVDLAETVAELTEQLHAEQSNSQMFQERFAELELAIDAQGWDLVAGGGDRELSRHAIGTLSQLARNARVKNPLIRRAVRARSAYTFGEGVTISANEQPAADVWIADHLDDRGNKTSLFSHQAMVEADRWAVACDGNLFVALFTDRATGRVKVRQVPLADVVDVVCDPDDRTRPWFYLTATSTTTLTGQTVTEKRWHPALWFEPDQRASFEAQLRGRERAPVAWDAPLLHLKADASVEMRWGIPEVYAALDWAKAYKEFLEDWATLVRSLSRFAFRVSTPGRKTAATRNKLAASNASPTGDGPAPAGADFVAPAGYNIEAIPKTGATVESSDGKQLRLMVAAAMDLPDTVLSGDADQGNRATSETMSRPTELAMQDRQRMWAGFLDDICTYIVAAGIRAGRVPGKVTVDGDNIAVLVEGEPLHVSITMPAIMAEDPLADIQALVTAATLDGKSDAGVIPRDAISRHAMQALGFDRIEDLVAQLADVADDAPGDAQMAEALGEVRTALAALTGS